MSDIAVRHQSPLPALPAPAIPAPALSHMRSLAAHAEARARYEEALERERSATSDAARDAAERERERMFVGPPPRLPVLTVAEQSQVRDARAAIAEALQTPVTLEVMREWLLLINAGVRNPLDERAFAVKLVGLLGLLGDLPACVFTLATARRLAPDFIPSPGEVRRLVEPDVRALQAKLDALDEMARPRPAAPPPRPEITQAERDAVAARVAALDAEMQAKIAAETRPTLRSRVLTTEQRIAACRETLARNPMNGPARTMLAALERQSAGQERGA